LSRAERSPSGFGARWVDETALQQHGANASQGRPFPEDCGGPELCRAAAKTERNHEIKTRPAGSSLLAFQRGINLESEQTTIRGHKILRFGIHGF
jgi:hypothetical protein